jgi:hypothetical protein
VVHRYLTYILLIQINLADTTTTATSSATTTTTTTTTTCYFYCRHCCTISVSGVFSLFSIHFVIFVSIAV